MRTLGIVLAALIVIDVTLWRPNHARIHALTTGER